MSQPRPSMSLANVLVIVLPVAIIGLGAYWWSTGLETKAREELASNVFSRILSTNAAVAGGPTAYADKDGDLVADPPEDAAKLIAPDVLMFSFVAGEVESVEQDAWQPLLAAIGRKDGPRSEIHPLRHDG